MKIRGILLVGTLIALLLSVGFAGTALAETTEAPVQDLGAIDGDYGYSMPPDVSADGHKIDSLINYVHIFMAVLFVPWGIFMVYCLVRFRQRQGHRAVTAQVKAKPAKYAEVAVVVVEAVLLLSFSIPIWASVKNDIPSDDENPLVVRVVAEQFAWNFHYPGDDGVFGRTGPEHIDTALNPVGLDPTDPNGTDDFSSGEFGLQVDRPTICRISSKDVIHGFGIPVLRVKQDAIPGMQIPVWFTATKTGTYQVACAQLCGNNHYKMSAPMKIWTQADFDAWHTKKSAPPEEFDEDELED